MNRVWPLLGALFAGLAGPAIQYTAGKAVVQSAPLAPRPMSAHRAGRGVWRRNRRWPKGLPISAAQQKRNAIKRRNRLRHKRHQRSPK